MTKGAIQEDAHTTVEDGGPLSEDEGAEALLNQFMKDSPPEDGEADDDVKKDKKVDAEDDSDDDDEESGEEQKDEDAQDDSDDSDEGEDDDDEDTKNILPDDADAYVTIKVNDEDRTVNVRDLKRLYGQEASLTRKSQEVASKRKEAEELGATYVAGMTGMLQKAQAKAAPYKNIDWIAAAQKLEPDDLSSLKAEADQYLAEENYLGQELNQFMQDLGERRKADLVEKGRQAVAELKRDIPGWDEKVYNDVRHFAISSGMETDIVDNLVDASALKLIHKAMLYDKGKAGVVTKKKGGKPKKVIKTSKSSGVSTKDALKGGSNVKRNLKKLEQSGSTDDAAAAFMAGWENSE